ncbi:MAG: hypothetical protein US57_C0016G0033 [Candidatus Moranbacteria bacterium GW2011_GWC2_37_73]|nr:MAG: hypothetical protein US57_C0016G0033 [Candidatus Moranbacteria bacterium GW2011_GWC2_37_73]
MFFILGIWFFSMGSLFQGEKSDSNQKASTIPDISQQLKDIKEQAPSIKDFNEGISAETEYKQIVTVIYKQFLHNKLKIIYKSYAFRNISFLANCLPAGRQVGDSNSLSFWILSICPKACQIRNC